MACIKVSTVCPCLYRDSANVSVDDEITMRTMFPMENTFSSLSLQGPHGKEGFAGTPGIPVRCLFFTYPVFIL